MKQQHADYQVVPYPKYRRWMVAAFRSTQHKSMMHGLLEVDVTRVRAHLREHQVKTGKSLSFTAFLIACLAKAVDEHKAVQAFRLGSKRLILFEEVDVLTDIERDVAGKKYIVPHIVRAANRKTVRELHDEIRAAQGADVKNALKRFPFLFLPSVLYRPILWAFGWIGRRRPWLWKSIVGTVEISAVGMFGNGAGWGIPPAAATTLMLTVGNRREARGRGRAHHRPGVSEPDDQRGSRHRRWRARRTLHPTLEGADRKRLRSVRLHGRVGAVHSGRRVNASGGGHSSCSAMRAERKRLLGASHIR